MDLSEYKSNKLLFERVAELSFNADDGGRSVDGRNGETVDAN